MSGIARKKSRTSATDRSCQPARAATPGAPPAAASSRWARRLERALLLAGAGLFAVLLHEIGARVVLDNLRLVGWGIALIVLQELVAYTFNTLGWWYAFPSPPPRIGFGRLLAVRLAGDAINSVTPTATLGGELVRVRLLREQVAATPAMASVVIARLSQTVAQVLYIALSLALLLNGSTLGPGLHRDLVMIVALMGVVTAALLVAQRRGLFSPLVAALRALGLARSTSRLTTVVARLDDEIAAFHAAGAGRFVRSAACFFVGWVAGLLEAALILFFLRVPISFECLLAIEILSIAIDGVLFFVPGKLGTQEGGKVLIFTLLGLSPAQGLSFGILRRIRELAWAGAGLVLLSRLQADLRRPPRQACGDATGEPIRA